MQASLTVPQALLLAQQHQHAGRLAEAETLCRQILAVAPEHLDALHLLARLAHQGGHPQAALELVRHVLQAGPTAQAHYTQGAVLMTLGRPAEAEPSFAEALRADATLADAWSGLGHAQCLQGRRVEALAAFERAIALRPGFASARINRADVLAELGRFDEAIAEYREAARLDPHSAPLRYNLGVTLLQRGRLAEAVAELQQVTTLRPQHADAYHNLGVALADLGRIEEAIGAYTQSIALRPGAAVTQNNLGNALRRVNRLAEAEAAYAAAIAAAPEYAEACSNLASLRLLLGELDTAIALYRRAVELKPDYASAHSNLLFALHCGDQFTPEEIFAEHRRWEALHAAPEPSCFPENSREPGRRLRIGYVSPDFCAHPVATFLENVLAAHDRSQVHVTCYSCVAFEDEVTGRLRAHADEWRSLAGRSDAEAAALIRADGIDVLVDLAGHTADHRLAVFSRKPAPVQVTWLGYCDTSGLRTMDWRLTDAHADPPGMTEALHTERLFRLPGTAWCFRPPAASPEVAPPPCLAGGGVTFGCFNMRQKITPAALRLWARLVRETPGSRLLLKNVALAHGEVRERMRAALAGEGLTPDRFSLAGPLASHAEHLEFHRHLDLALDTFPYAGTTTTCEALWMGVPVITLAGRTHASRVGVSLLHAVGLGDLVAADGGEYLSIARRLAGDPERLRSLRRELRPRMAASTLTDGPRSARNLEAAFREMWREWCARP